MSTLSDSVNALSNQHLRCDLTQNLHERNVWTLPQKTASGISTPHYPKALETAPSLRGFSYGSGVRGRVSGPFPLGGSANLVRSAHQRLAPLRAGVQSTVMLLMACHREIGPMPDAVIFADTGWEPKAVYDHLDFLDEEVSRLTNGRLSIERVSKSNLRQDLIDNSNSTGQRFAAVPFFTETGGIGKRQCTNEYKLVPINKKVRELIGVSPGKRVPKDVLVEMWIGISIDEVIRMKMPREKWKKNHYPLIELGLSRHDCFNWFKRKYPGRPLVKSACIGCPFHNDAMWREMKNTDEESWFDAVFIDHLIRRGGTLGKMLIAQYMHRSCQPLDEVDFRNLEDLGQINLFNNECEGMCGV